MENAQLSFIDLVTVNPVEPPKPPSPMELLAAGLKRDRMGRDDRTEFLEEQVRKMNQRK